jgi:aspartyl-tRNA(Asn)/glutamyl-tRNA(Gln) amidotransferase subunit B
MADYEEDFVKTGEPHHLSLAERAKLGSNAILGEVSRIINDNNINIIDFRKRVSPEQLSRLLALNSEGVVSTATCKSMLEEMFETGIGLTAQVIAERGLGQISDAQELKEVVSKVITVNAQAVVDYKSGKEQALKFLVGQVMKTTKGRANPKLVNELIKGKLAEGLSVRGKG